MGNKVVRVNRDGVYLTVTWWTTTKFTSTESTFTVNLAAGRGWSIVVDLERRLAAVNVTPPVFTEVDVERLNTASVDGIGL